MEKFTAEYSASDGYGKCICAANTIKELYKKLNERGFKYADYSFYDALEWEKTNDKKFYGLRIEIRRGELEMTEYTSL